MKTNGSVPTRRWIRVTYPISSEQEALDRCMRISGDGLNAEVAGIAGTIPASWLMLFSFSTTKAHDFLADGNPAI